MNIIIIFFFSLMYLYLYSPPFYFLFFSFINLRIFVSYIARKIHSSFGLWDKTHPVSQLFWSGIGIEGF